MAEHKEGLYATDSSFWSINQLKYISSVSYLYFSVILDQLWSKNIEWKIPEVNWKFYIACHCE